MSERPILFTPDNIWAILAGEKWQTRRVIKPQPEGGIRRSPFVPSGIEDGHGYELSCPYGAPGDLLWVKEAWAVDGSVDEARAAYEDVMGGTPGNGPYYRADKVHEGTGLTWRNAMYMPRWASRLTLRITEVRVERVQDISPDDCRAEGARPMNEASLLWRETIRANYRTLWDSINTKRGYPWDSNPWVWVVSFEVLK